MQRVACCCHSLHVTFHMHHILGGSPIDTGPVLMQHVRDAASAAGHNLSQHIAFEAQRVLLTSVLL